MNCPIVEVFPTELGLVPLDFFSFKETGTLVGVKISDPFVVREGVDESLMTEFDLFVDIPPMMSRSFAIDNEVEPMGKEVTFSQNVGAEVVFELGIEVVFFLDR